MVVHQTPSPDLDIGRAAGVAKEIPVQRIVFVAKESLLPPIATLRHVMGNARNNNARQPSHGSIMIGLTTTVKLCALSPFFVPVKLCALSPGFEHQVLMSPGFDVTRF